MRGSSGRRVGWRRGGACGSSARSSAGSVRLSPSAARHGAARRRKACQSTKASEASSPHRAPPRIGTKLASAGSTYSSCAVCVLRGSKVRRSSCAGSTSRPIPPTPRPTCVPSGVAPAAAASRAPAPVALASSCRYALASPLEGAAPWSAQSAPSQPGPHVQAQRAASSSPPCAHVTLGHARAAHLAPLQPSSQLHAPRRHSPCSEQSPRCTHSAESMRVYARSAATSSVAAARLALSARCASPSAAVSLARHASAALSASSSPRAASVWLRRLASSAAIASCAARSCATPAVAFARRATSAATSSCSAAVALRM